MTWTTANGWRRSFIDVRAVVYAIALSLWSMAAAEARTIHVSASAQSTGTGSASAPFRSLASAVADARPGDVINIRTGVYTEQITLTASGTAARPITLRAAPGETVILRELQPQTSRGILVISGNNIVVEGLKIEGSHIVLWGTRNVTVRGNEITGSYGPGIWVGYSRPGVSRNNLIEMNTVHGNCLMNQRRNRTGGWPVAIAIAKSDDTVVRHNLVHSNYGEGIGVLSAHRVVFANNTVWDNFSVNIYLDNAPETRVQGNLVGTTGNRRFFRSGNPAHGVVIANEPTDVVLPSRGISVVGNVLFGVAAPFYSDYGLNTGLHDSNLSGNQVMPNRRLPSEMLVAQTS